MDESQLRATVTKAEIVGGDAHVICVSNKIKHIFDFNVKLDFSLEIDESMGLQPQAEVRQRVRDSAEMIVRQLVEYLSFKGSTMMG